MVKSGWTYPMGFGSGQITIEILKYHEISMNFVLLRAHRVFFLLMGVESNTPIEHSFLLG